MRPLRPPSDARSIGRVTGRTRSLERRVTSAGGGSEYDDTAVLAAIAALDDRADALEAYDIAVDGRLDALEAAVLDLQTYSLAGPRAVLNGDMRWYAPTDCYIDFVHASLSTAPTGADFNVRVNKNGSSLVTCTIVASAFTDTSVPGVQTVTAGDYFTVDVTQIGSTIPGSDLVVQFVGRWT